MKNERWKLNFDINDKPNNDIYDKAKMKNHIHK